MFAYLLAQILTLSPVYSEEYSPLIFKDNKPFCYMGTPEFALQELLNLDFKPALINVALLKGNGQTYIYAEQPCDGSYITFILPECKN